MTTAPSTTTNIMSGTHTLPDLPYTNDALEPYIIAEIMKLHHDKHHKTYVDALNAAENNYARATTPKERIALQSALRFNGGGHINHSLFWKNLAPAPDGKHAKGNGGVLKDGPLKNAIKHEFGSLEGFIKEFNSTTVAIQGSGWGWLVCSPQRCCPFSSHIFGRDGTPRRRSSRSSPPPIRTLFSLMYPSSASMSGSMLITCSTLTPGLR